MRAKNRLLAVLVTLLALLLLAFFLPTLLNARAMKQLEQEAGPLRVERFLRQGVPKDNPGSRLLAAGAALDISPAGHELLRRASRSDLDVNAERPRIAELLAKNAEILQAARSIGPGPSSLNIDYAVWDARLPNLLHQMDLARLLYLQGRLALADGDAPGVLDAARSLGRQAEVLESEPLMVIQILGLFSERLQLQLLKRLAEEGPAPASGSGALLVANDLRERYRETISLEAFNFIRAVDAMVERLGRPRPEEKRGDKAVRSYVSVAGSRARGLMGYRALNRYRLYLDAFDRDYASIAALGKKPRPGLFESPFTQLGPDYSEIPARYRAVNATRALLRQCLAIRFEGAPCPSPEADGRCLLKTPDGAELARWFPQREPVIPQECAVPRRPSLP